MVLRSLFYKNRATIRFSHLTLSEASLSEFVAVAKGKPPRVASPSWRFSSQWKMTTLRSRGSPVSSAGGTSRLSHHSLSASILTHRITQGRFHARTVCWGTCGVARSPALELRGAPLLPGVRSPLGVCVPAFPTRSFHSCKIGFQGVYLTPLSHPFLAACV